MRHLLFFIFSVLLFAGCEKQEKQQKNYVKFQSNKSEYNFIAGENGWEEVLVDNAQREITGGFCIYTGNAMIRNIYQTKLNQFLIIFHNIAYSTIKKGTYNYYGSIVDGDTIKSGIEILWMSQNEWYQVIGKYKQSEDYNNCLSKYSKYENVDLICSESTIYESDFFSTRNYNQGSGSVDIRNIYPTDYSYKDETSYENQNSKYITVEGQFTCMTVSRLDTTEIKNISGDFKILVPSPLNSK